MALVWEKPRKPEPEPEPELEPENAAPARADPDLPLVTVLETSDPLAIAAAKGLLDDAAISFYVSGDEIGARYSGHGIFWTRRVQVGRDRETEARALLSRFAEINSTGDRRK